MMRLKLVEAKGLCYGYYRQAPVVYMYAPSVGTIHALQQAKAEDS